MASGGALDSVARQSAGVQTRDISRGVQHQKRVLRVTDQRADNAASMATSMVVRIRLSASGR